MQNKLENGMVFKNYKELCAFMEWKVQSGKSKQLQHKDLERMCKYHKEGNKYIIDEVFEKAKKKEDKRKGNSGKSMNSRGNNKVIYTDDLKISILSLLINDAQTKNPYNVVGEGNHIYGRFYLYSALGLTNVNYKTLSKNQRQYSAFKEIDINVVKEFFTTTDKALSRNVANSINSLQSMKLIDCTTDCVMVSFNEDKLDENGNPIYKKCVDYDEYGEMIEVEYKEQLSTKPIMCSEKDRLAILLIQREEMEKLNCNNEFEIIYRDLYKRWVANYTKRIRAEVKGMENFRYCYKSFQFLFNADPIIRYLQSLDYNVGDTILYRKTLNEKFGDTVVKNSKVRIKNAEKREDDKYEYRLYDNFIDNIDSIKKDVINLCAKDIRATIYKKKK